MTVIRPNSISGITSITAQANEINVFKSDGTLAGLSLNGVNVNTTTGISTYAALNVTGNVSVGGTLTYQDVTNIDSVGIVTARSGVRVPDNVYSYFGTGNDLSIRHDASGGNHSYIFNHGAGVFKLASDTQMILGETTNRNYIQMNPNSDVKLFFNNNQKFATSTNGIEVTGQMYSNSAEIRGAAGGDAVLNLFSDAGSQNADKVRLRQTHVGNSFLLESYASGAYQSILKGTDTRSVELHYQGSKKFETTTNGAEITGQLDITGGFVSLDDNYSVVMGTGGDAQLYHSGSHQYLLNTTGNTYFMPKASETGIAIIPDGSVELYHDNGKEFETRSDGAAIPVDGHGLKIGANNDVRLYHETNNWSYLAHYNTSGSLGIESVNDISIRNTSGEKYIYCTENGTVELYHDNSKKAWTQSWGFQTDGHIIPYGNNSHDLGASNERWRNIYTNDLNLSNEGGANDVDGTWGNYTIQEGESDLFLINKRSGKKYKFNLTEVS